jgi:hypothetical protein
VKALDGFAGFARSRSLAKAIDNQVSNHFCGENHKPGLFADRFSLGQGGPVVLTPQKPIKIPSLAFVQDSPKVGGSLGAALVNRRFTHAQEIGQGGVRFKPLFLANPVKNGIYIN